MAGTKWLQERRPTRERYLELAVPLIAFSTTIAGILLWECGVRIDFQYFSAGCLISSWILAYLAWIRPKKDIVALSTPVYGIIFLCTPMDVLAGAVFQLFYAAGLTILLFRLKHRFEETAPAPDNLSSDEPLGRYRDRVTATIPPVPSDTALTAGRVFILFANGEYEQARSLAVSNIPTPNGPPRLIDQAFAIVAEQAGQMVDGGNIPDEFTRFLPEQESALFFPVGSAMDRDRQYSGMLDNALILLYVVAIRNHESGTGILKELEQLRPFARKLCGD